MSDNEGVVNVNETRLQQLERKARAVGVSDVEAVELGRLYAEAAGEPYTSHAMLVEETAPVPAPVAVAPSGARRTWWRRGRRQAA